jgi:DNA-binding Lrp family transcriptional regulator
MERDEESGTYTQKYSDSDFLSAVEKHNPASTSEVADEVGCTRRNADMRLKRLADEEKVKRKKIAASQVWTLVKSD